MDTMDFVIEQGYRQPVARIGRPLRWPWDRMSVGDSFLLPLPALDNVVNNRMLSSANSWGHRSGGGARFVSRWLDEPKSGYRVWRIA